MSRYNSLMNLINAGGYDLAAMKERLHGLADRGELTLDERDKLIARAEEKANPLKSTNVEAKILELDARMRAIEAKLGMTDEPETDEDGAEIVPEYVEGKWYYAGDKVTWEGKVYECIAPDGVVCVWSPSAYPAYWREVVA